jgi:adenylate kinase
METEIQQWLGSGSINLFGLPYAGKDTQGEKLAKLFDGTLMGGGQILRNSVIPPHVKTAMEAGDLAPTQEYIDIVLPYLSKPEFAGRPLILSAVGRWIGEEQGVLEATEQSGHPMKAVIFLTIDESVLRARWQSTQSAGGRGERADDAEHILDTRLAEFYAKTLPVIEAYRNKGLLIEIDASANADTVNQQILSALANRASKAQ